MIGGMTHAGIWSGTASSFIDLNPAGASASYGMGTSGNAQAGDANFDHSHAVLWFGSASTFLDLDAVLSSDYSRDSHAMSVWINGSAIQVGGYALNQAGNPAPILWTITPVPEPSTFALAGLGAAALMIGRRAT